MTKIVNRFEQRVCGLQEDHLRTDNFTAAYIGLQQVGLKE